MNPDTIEFLQDAGNVVLGAVLGFVDATWSDWWKDRKKAQAMKGAIRRELRETAHRFLALVYTLNQRHGGSTASYFNGCIRRSSDTRGPIAAKACSLA